MRISDKGIAILVKFEGERLEVYLDPIGLPTLGVGHLLTKAERKKLPVGTPISKAVSRAYLHEDLERFEDALSRLIEVRVTQNQYDALCSLIFNIGIEAFTRSQVLKKLNRKDYQGAADAFLSWVNAGGKVLPGLVTRRKAERKLFLAPDSKSAISADDEPATGGGETQTNQSDPPPTSSREPFSFGSMFETVLGAVDKTADAEARIGKSRWAVGLGTKAVGWIMMVFAEYWEVLLVGTVLIAFGSWYLWKARKSSHKVVNLRIT